MAGTDNAELDFRPSTRGGEAGRLIAGKDWSATSLGPMSGWPRCLRSYLSLVLDLPTPAIIFWGKEQVQLYNDAYAVIMGPRHPRFLGGTYRECWPETLATGVPWMARVYDHGETLAVERRQFALTRNGFAEDVFFSFTFTPLRDDDDRVAGILQLVTDVTDGVLAERRTKLVHELSRRTQLARGFDEACSAAIDVLASSVDDLPYCRFYVTGGGDPAQLVSVRAHGAPAERFPRHLDARPGVVALTAELRRQLGRDDFHLLPMRGAECDDLIGVLVAGVSPRLPFDPRYHAFLELCAAQLGASLSAVRACEDQRRAIAELDAFSYSVSHDLRAPLRAIDGFSSALLMDYGDALDDQGKHYLKRTRAATQRMATLIDDLLALSRVSRAPLRRAQVDVSALARSIAAELTHREPGRVVRFDIEPGLAAHVDGDLLEIVLDNLLGNAWKFSNKVSDGHIVFGRAQAAGELAFFVRDNGAGFDMTYADKLFAPFTRLHRDSDFEGTGIGLATVSRIISRHGGRVWAEAALGKGATFFFTLGDPS